MTREELKPCPFCGAEAERIFIGNDFTKTRKVEIECTGCHTKMVVGAIRNTHEWCDETVTKKWNNRQQPLPPAEGAEAQRCPICGGNGLVPNGFYDQVSGQWSTTSITPETCHTCNGTGFIMASFLHAQRIADKIVSERLREELIKYSMYASEQWCDTSDRELSEKNIDEYLNGRNK